MRTFPPIPLFLLLVACAGITADPLPKGGAEAAPPQEPSGKTRDPAGMEAPLSPAATLRSEEILKPLFSTGEATLVRQVGLCMPVQACTWVVSRRPGQPDQRLKTVADLAAVVPEIKTSLEALALVSFLTENHHSFQGFDCELGVMRDGVFDRWELPPGTRGDPSKVTTSDARSGPPFVLTRYLGCYTEAEDQLVLTRETVDGDGSYTFSIQEVVHRGRFLPRYR